MFLKDNLGPLRVVLHLGVLIPRLIPEVNHIQAIGLAYSALHLG